MSTLIVKGGAGFIGSNFVRHALESTGYSVVNLDLLTSWRGKPRRSGRGRMAPVFSSFENSAMQYCPMQRLQAFKYELRPNGEKERKMLRFAGSCRFVFNKALALQKERYERGEKKLGYADLCKLITEWRNGPETPWLKDAPVHLLQQTLNDLERAYANLFAKRSDFPRFKKKGQRDSFRYPDPKQIRHDQACSQTCPNCGHVSVDNRRTQERFACVGCEFEENADGVGAINILRAGHARFACEVSGAPRPPATGTHRSDSGVVQCHA